MTHDETTVLLLKGLIAEMTPADQEEVKGCADQFRAILKEKGTCGVVAFSLVGAEMSVKAGG